VAIAKTKAKPEKDAPMMKKDKNECGCGGDKVEAIPYYKAGIERLNVEVDREREAVYAMASDGSTSSEALGERLLSESKYGSIRGDGSDRKNLEINGEPSTTGYVTVTSL
jgi:hypothetical protein